MQKQISVFLVFSLFTISTIAAPCERPEKSRAIRVTAVGDILIHEALYRAVVQSGKDFSLLWQPVAHDLAQADLTVGNLEGPVAPGVSVKNQIEKDPGFVYDGHVYSGTNFRFNFHPLLLKNLKQSGFDLLTTANNHTMDRGTLGVEKTIEELNKINMPFVGTRTRSGGHFLRVLNIKGFRVGAIACAEALNGWPDPYKLTLSCQSPEVTQLIRESRQDHQLTLVFPHWGAEYQLRPSATQRRLAQQWVSAGADAIIGNHPHVLQTVEKMGSAIVVYSLGNFVAGQAAATRRASALLHLDFEENNGRLILSQYSYTPIARQRGSLSQQKLDLRKDSEELRIVKQQLGQPLCQD